MPISTQSLKAFAQRGSPNDDSGDPKDPDVGKAVQAAIEKSEAHEDELVETLFKDFDPEIEGVCPSWVMDEDLWNRSRADLAVQWNTLPEPWLTLAYVYQELGGEWDTSQLAGDEEDEGPEGEPVNMEGTNSVH